jgi:hypothetical protein
MQKQGAHFPARPLALPFDSTRRFYKAEADYITAQLLADQSVSVVEQLSAEQAERAAHEQSVRQAVAARLFSTMRGDN